MATDVLPLMDIENPRSYMDDVYSNDTDKCLAALVEMKNMVIGSNRQKANVIDQGVVPRLTQLIADIDQPFEIRNEAVIIVGSLARGTIEQVQQLMKFDIVPLIFNCIAKNSEDCPIALKFMESCLRCVCAIFEYDFAPTDLVFKDQMLLSHMLNLVKHSVRNKISVTTILSVSVKTPEHQTMLWDEGAVFSLAALLDCSNVSVLMPTLACVAALCYENQPVSVSINTASFGGKSMPDLIIGLLSRDKQPEMQLAAAKCMTYLYRAGALVAENNRVMFKTLPVLVSLCQSCHPWKLRVDAAEILSYLIEVSVELQRVAAISNHLVPTLTSFIKTDTGVPPAQADMVRKELLQAAFRVFACLGANDEDIRKKIIESDIADHIVRSLDDQNPKVKLAAIRCLHSLSRSVQQLRTTFQDHNIWRHLLRILENAEDDVLVAASSTLCNLLLEFSPAKEPILESGALDLICSLVKKDDPSLRLNGMWALMNMSFRADQKIKMTLMDRIGMNRILGAVKDQDTGVAMKALGLLRNLLSSKKHIDFIMQVHGRDIIETLVTLLNDITQPTEIKEQMLCILANIADGEYSKDMIMNNQEALDIVKEYLNSEKVQLQSAAVFCVSNLAWKEEIGFAERQAKLIEMGIPSILNTLMFSTDVMVFDRAKTALTQFSNDGNGNRH